MLHLTYLLLDSALTLDNSPVFQSQTLDWIRVQRVSGIQVGLVCTAEDMARFDEVAGRILREHEVPYVTIPHRALWLNVVAGALALRRFHRRQPARKVYVRSVWGALAHWLAYPLGGPTLLYDFRGDVVAEAQSRGRHGFRHLLLKTLTRWAIRRADQLLCVSSPAAELLAQEYGRPGAVVIPSAVDGEWFRRAQSQREVVRKSLGVGKADLLLVYSGGLNRYQMVPEMLRIWAALQEVEGVYFLLLLSQQPTAGKFPSLPGLLPPGRMEVQSVPREKVPEYLAAADVGFLLRQDHPLNRVASPVKFGEYLAAGLAVVTSLGLGDVADLVAERNLGVLVDPEDPGGAAELCKPMLEVVRADREGFRARSLQAAEEKLDWNVHLAIWKELVGVNAKENHQNTLAEEEA